MGRPCVRRTSNYFRWIVTSELDLSLSEVINKPKLIKGEGYSYMESGFLLSDPKEDTHLALCSKRKCMLYDRIPNSFSLGEEPR